MSNSPLVDFTRISPNSTNPRNHKIDTIVIHHMAGNLSVESCGAGFADPARQASSNYSVGTDGRVGMYVEEKNRSWCSSNREVDHRGISIEVANDSRAPDWHVSDVALAKLIDLCTDICQRNGIARLNFTGDKTGNLVMHKYYAATECPGPYLGSKFPYIADQVNARLGSSAKPAEPEPPKTANPESTGKLYRVQVGSFSKKAYAERKRQAVEAAGFNAYLACVDGALWRVQVGGSPEKADAEKVLAQLQKAGFSGYVTTLSGQTETAAKTVEQVAREVIQGKWGNGAERKQKLTAAGYDYDVIQAKVNVLMGKK